MLTAAHLAADAGHVEVRRVLHHTSVIPRVVQCVSIMPYYDLVSNTSMEGSVCGAPSCTCLVVKVLPAACRPTSPVGPKVAPVLIHKQARTSKHRKINIKTYKDSKTK